MARHPGWRNARFHSSESATPAPQFDLHLLTGRSVPEDFGLFQCGFIVAFAADRAQFHPSSNIFAVDPVVYAMGTDKTDEHHAPVMAHSGDESIIVAFNVKN